MAAGEKRTGFPPFFSIPSFDASSVAIWRPDAEGRCGRGGLLSTKEIPKEYHVLTVVGRGMDPVLLPKCLRKDGIPPSQVSNISPLEISQSPPPPSSH